MADDFNAFTYLVDRHCQDGAGDRVAVRGSRTLTYAELSTLTGELAAAYRRLGLRRDDRVMFVASDDVELFAGILGAFRAGLVAVPVSTMLNGSEIGKVLADSGARLVVATHEFADAVSTALEAAPEVEFAVLHGDGALTTPARTAAYTWEDFHALAQGTAEEQRATAVTNEDSWALWLYTSGTTGTPKAAMHRHANIRHVCETYGNQVLGITAEDSCFSVAKHRQQLGRAVLEPDMITCAKGLTSGYAPLGAMIASDKLMEPFLHGTEMFAHGYTFGGHPVSSAVALANLDVFESEGINKHVLANQDAFRSTLEKLNDLPIVGDVRGDGYFYGIELVKDKATKETFNDAESEKLLRGFLSKALFDAGLYCRADDRGDPVIQLSPPLICEQEHFDEMEQGLRSVLEQAWTLL